MEPHRYEPHRSEPHHSTDALCKNISIAERTIKQIPACITQPCTCLGGRQLGAWFAEVRRKLKKVLSLKVSRPTASPPTKTLGLLDVVRIDIDAKTGTTWHADDTAFALQR